MTGARIDVDGADRFARTLRDVPERIEEGRALDDAGRLVVQRARAYAPTLTGALARGLTPIRVTPTAVLITTDVGTYSRVQEYGSVNTPAHPYARPALDQSPSAVVALVKRDADAALRTVKGA